MTHGSIRVCRDARASYWQLGPLPPPRGSLTLLAWTSEAAVPDSGVPPEVAGILARTWTSIARVTFPSSLIGVTGPDAWSESEAGLVRALSHPGILERALARLHGAPAGATLISTRQPDIASRLFEDPGFPWWLQGQAVVLSDSDRDPPDIDERSLLAFFEDGWSNRAATLGAGVHGIVRPGVDGDVAGLLALDEGFDARQLETLERETRAAGMAWSIVPEAALGSTSPPP